MQKWLPDEFASGPSAAAAVVPGNAGVFESEKAINQTDKNDKQRLFQSESGFAGPETIMAHLSREERAQVFDLVEQDIRTEYGKREVEFRAQLDAELTECRRNFDDTLNTWSENLYQAMSSHLKDTSDAAARLAVQLAEKIVRKNISLDNEVLLRAIETALFKIDGTKAVTLNVSPEQAQWLESQPLVAEKLGIKQIISDRRIESGGCVVKTEKQEWDVTVAGQLKFLSEMVEEMISIADAPDLTGKEGTDAEPNLE